MDNLKEKWIEYHSTNDKSLFGAWECLNTLVFEQPEKAWTVVLGILEQTNSDDIISSLAAGPLEDLLSEHGDIFIDEVELKTRQNPKFTKLILGVLQGGMSKEIWSRVKLLQDKYAIITQ
jgi:hypothetical protein